MDLGIFLAALGITLLELTEASAVGLALYADSKDAKAFLWVTLGVLVVFIPTVLVGKAIALLPVFWVRIIAATFLLYFGLRLSRSARRSALRSIQAKISGNQKATEEHYEKGIMSTGFSVGVVEAFEAAIVLVALIPISFISALSGAFVGILTVIIGTYLLRTQVRKLKQAYMKIFVSALLLSFSTFWFVESFMNINDIVLILFFLIYSLAVFIYSYKYKISGELP
ncbi:MAG: hypothetical protein ACP5GS_05500 [Nitrososphaeria archaeon]